MKINVYKETDDDWCGNYRVEGDVRVSKLVCVSFIQLRPHPQDEAEWRVCVWGNDDFGMARDFEDETAALNIFYQVIGWPKVNMSLLRNIGFISA